MFDDDLEGKYEILFTEFVADVTSSRTRPSAICTVHTGKGMFLLLSPSSTEKKKWVNMALIKTLVKCP